MNDKAIVFIKSEIHVMNKAKKEFENDSSKYSKMRLNTIKEGLEILNHILDVLRKNHG
jgi:hypothetical protein